MMIEREVVFLVCAYMCEREYLYVTRSCCVCVRFDDRFSNENTKRREKRREYKRRSTNEALTSTKEALKKLNLSKA